MMYYTVKIVLTTLLIVSISELSKRNALIAALLASLPLVSILAMLWLFIDTHDVNRVAELATQIFWLVLPSLALFISLPFFLKQGLDFYVSMGLAIALTAGCYGLMLMVLKQ